MEFYTYKLFSLIAALWAIIASPFFARAFFDHVASYPQAVK
jgi:hypothetical protein